MSKPGDSRTVVPFLFATETAEASESEGISENEEVRTRHETSRIGTQEDDKVTQAKSEEPKADSGGFERPTRLTACLLSVICSLLSILRTLQLSGVAPRWIEKPARSGYRGPTHAEVW